MGEKKKAFFRCVASFYNDYSGRAKVYLSSNDAFRRQTDEPEIAFDSLEDLEDQLMKRYQMES